MSEFSLHVLRKHLFSRKLLGQLFWNTVHICLNHINPHKIQNNVGPSKSTKLTFFLLIWIYSRPHLPSRACSGYLNIRSSGCLLWPMDIPSSGCSGGVIRMSSIEVWPAVIRSRNWVGLGWLWFWLFHWLPDSAWVDGKLAELAEQLGKVSGTS